MERIHQNNDEEEWEKTNNIALDLWNSIMDNNPSQLSFEEIEKNRV